MFNRQAVFALCFLLGSTAAMASQPLAQRVAPAGQCTEERAVARFQQPASVGLEQPLAWIPVDDRPACKDKYPLPDGWEDWPSSSCTVGYRSACGGPPQCSCEPNQRLLDYHCPQGTYSLCDDEEGKNGCR
jgi:hypothetical protein